MIRNWLQSEPMFLLQIILFGPRISLLTSEMFMEFSTSELLAFLFGVKPTAQVYFVWIPICIFTSHTFMHFDTSSLLAFT